MAKKSAAIAERNAGMIAYKKEGHTAKEVSEKFGTTLETARWVCRNAFPMRDNTPISEEKKEQMRAYKTEGHKNREVAERFGVSLGFASQVCKGISGYTARDDAMREYKAQGHTLPEVAAHFGTSEGVASVVCKGIAPQEPRVRPGGASLKGRLRNNEYVADTVRAKTPGFEYTGNYTGTDGTADLRCKVCGHIQTRSWVSVRHGTVVCDACVQRKQEKAREEKEEKKVEIRKQKAAAIAWSRYEKSIKQQAFAICRECGTLFVPTRGNKVVCSDECRRRRGNNRKDRRLKGVEKGNSITLRKVYEKAAGVCYLCGGMCDWDDIETREDGTMVAGDRYPSIDHVYPISLGGTHTWDNVRLAHRWCNSVKSDNPQGS